MKYIVKIFYDLYELHEEDGSTRYLRWNRWIRAWQWGAYSGWDTQELPTIDFDEATKGYTYYNNGKIEDIKLNLGKYENNKNK